MWGQLVRAADSASNNLVEADDAVSDADFLNKMGIALREAKESRIEEARLQREKEQSQLANQARRSRN